MAREDNVGSEIITIDRRANDRRKGDPTDSQMKAIISAQIKKEKVQRRRQIDPTTCERDYSNDEVEFMKAYEDYKRSSGRNFPTCSEILEVVRGLGYVRTRPNLLGVATGQDEVLVLVNPPTFNNILNITARADTAS